VRTRFATRVSICCFACCLPLMAQGSWTGRASMPTPREAFGIARTPDGLIYAIGGDAFSGTYVPSNVVEVYNPATDSWSSRAPMGIPRYALSAAYASGKIYAFGGYNGGPMNAVEAYDPATNTWAPVAPMPTARHSSRAITGNDGKIYVIGGDASGGGANVATLEIYDPPTNSWSTGTSMPNVKTSACAALGADGLIYVAGGGQSGVISASTFAYDPTTGVWSIRTSMLVPRETAGCTSLPDGRIVAAGGHVGGAAIVTSNVEIYNPATDIWSPGTPMANARSGLAAATALDGRVFAIGGWIPIPGGLLPLGTNEAFTPPVLFDYFEPAAQIDTTNQSFSVAAAVLLGAASNGISPMTEKLYLRVGGFTVTIPAGSFTSNGAGGFQYRGASLVLTVQPAGGSWYLISGLGWNAPQIVGATNPVTIDLAIGSDTGAKKVNAYFGYVPH
jgi:hypothetical protein